MEIILDYPGGPDIVLKDPYKGRGKQESQRRCDNNERRERERERLIEGDTPLTLKMEMGP